VRSSGGIGGPWRSANPMQPATKEHQTYTTATFEWHDLTLATVSIFEESAAPTDHGR
jgi:hypothetical protein